MKIICNSDLEHTYSLLLSVIIAKITKDSNNVNIIIERNRK